MNKLSEKDIERIKELRAKGVSFRALGRMFNVSDTAIYKRMLRFPTENRKNEVDTQE